MGRQRWERGEPLPGTPSLGQRFCCPSPKPCIAMVTIFTSWHLQCRIFFFFFCKGLCSLFICFIYCVPPPSCGPKLCASSTLVPALILAPFCCLDKGPTELPSSLLLRTKNTTQKPGADLAPSLLAWEGGEGGKEGKEGAVERHRAGWGLFRRARGRSTRGPSCWVGGGPSIATQTSFSSQQRWLAHVPNVPNVWWLPGVAQR